MIKVLIVDDEALARRRLKTLLDDPNEPVIIQECSNGLTAIDAIQSTLPDLMFLDVEMPEIDGFGVLEAVEKEKWPVTIFVTAYDRYAIRAFEFHALDYLLKPFNRSRFMESLARAKKRIRTREWDILRNRVEELLKRKQSESYRPDRIVVKEAGRIQFVDLEEIEWIKSAGNYLELHTAGETHLIRQSISNMETRLSPAEFVRVHRSVMVRIASIQFIERTSDGNFSLYLKSGQEIKSGKHFKKNLVERIAKRA